MKRLMLLGLSALLFGILSGCDDNDPSGGLSFQQAISDCGGFAAQGKSPIDSPGTYCDAELLLWAYDTSTQKLNLANNRIGLNCCGDHSIEVTMELGVMVVTETDAPGAARCRCDCVFDYTVEVDHVPADAEGEPLAVRIVRDVTDDELGPHTVWEGSLDLLDGQGTVTIDGSPLAYGCGSDHNY